MGNLGQREKYGLGLVAILIVAFIIYFAGIRSLQNQKDELEFRRNELNTQIATLEALKENNNKTQAQIDAITNTIKDIESTFIPVLKTESIEQFVISTFEKAGCPYLNTIKSEIVVPDAIVLPNGQAANDSLQIVRITAQFSTTDGFNVPQYNMEPDFQHDSATVEEYIDMLYGDNIDSTIYDSTAPMVEYENFVKGLKVIEKTGVPEGAEEGTASTCVKINSVKMESEGGYMLLTVEIDFYSASLADRLSEPVLTAPYVEWTGRTNVPNAGIMGRRFVFDEKYEDSAWYGMIMNSGDVVNKGRPFAAYWSRDLFDVSVAKNGNVYTAVTGISIDNPAPQEETPDNTEVPA